MGTWRQWARFERGLYGGGPEVAALFQPNADQLISASLNEDPIQSEYRPL
jgi:hypothetical protein